MRIRFCRSGPLWLAVAFALAGCDSGFPGSGTEPTISDESFVSTIVELRQATAQEGRISPERRDEILARRGVTEADLFHFVDVHGTNVPKMREIWTEVEARITGRDPDEFDTDPEGLEALPGMDPELFPSEEDPVEALPGTPAPSGS